MKVLRRLLAPRSDGSFLVPPEIVESFKDKAGGGRDVVLKLWAETDHNKAGCLFAICRFVLFVMHCLYTVCRVHAQMSIIAYGLFAPSITTYGSWLLLFFPGCLCSEMQEKAANDYGGGLVGRWPVHE